MRMKSTSMLAITLGAVGAGAGLMFLLDPDRGSRRRGFIGDKALRAANFFGKSVNGQSRDAANRVEGMAAETSARLAREAVADEVLAERVRSKIGRVVTRPLAIDVTAERGVVELRGAVLRSERKRVIGAAGSVRGVRGLQHDALMTYSEEQRMPGARPYGRSQELKQVRPRKKMSSLRLGLSLASGLIAGYKAFKRTSQPRERRSEMSPASSSDVAA